MTKEEWKPIPFEPSYEVSNYGNVRNRITRQVKTLRYDKSGYLRVTLYPSGITYSIHRLVMETFRPELRNQHIDHIDGNKTNNRLDNLEWVSIKENMIRRSKMYPDLTKGESNAMSKLTEAEVRAIKFNHPDKTNSELAVMYKVNPEQIRRIRNGQRWGHIVVSI